MPRRQVSIQNRMLLTVVVGILALGLTHLILTVFHENMVSFQKERQLSDYAANIAQSVVVIDNKIAFRSLMPQARFYERRSGLGAAILGGEKLLWISPSVEGYPPLPRREVGETSRGLFDFGSDKSPWHKLLISIPITEKGQDTGRLLRIYVFEDATPSILSVAVFKDAVSAAFLCAFILILGAQTITARWSVSPLRRLANELGEIKKGKKDHFVGAYPAELEDVGKSINELLDHETAQTSAYKNSLSNLAHSLKTPLAVIKGALENPDDDEVREGIRQQIKKIDDLVTYQLSLASRSGKRTFSAPIFLEPIAIELVEGLEKIHASKEAFCEFEVDSKACLPANKGDVQELLGNLLENGFKWCRSRVLLTIAQSKTEVTLMIEDDGHGVPEDKISVIMERGTRVDEQVKGHGIGLAIVADIVRSYDGKMTIGKSEELGGAKFLVTIPYDIERSK